MRTIAGSQLKLGLHWLENFGDSNLLFMEMISTPTARLRLFRADPVPVAAVKRTVFLVHRLFPAQSPVKVALQERGYEVVHAESVEEAWRIWAKLAIPIHLFLADISLGRDQAVERLLKLLQAENPRMRILFANDLEQATDPIAAQSYPQQLLSVVENCLL
jgi:hypothetical protein